MGYGRHGIELNDVSSDLRELNNLASSTRFKAPPGIICTVSFTNPIPLPIESPAFRIRTSAKWHAIADDIQRVTREQPDLTLAELKAELGTELSDSTLCRVLQALKLTLKKVLIASERNRPDVASQRDSWQSTQAGWDPSRLVFLDETWGKTNMTRPRGRALCGERVIDSVPHGHWTTTFLAALRCTGLAADGCLLVIPRGTTGCG